MSFYDCNSCRACGGKCDRCTLPVCLNNMESHKEIYKLTNEFDNKFHQALQNLYDRCLEIGNNLLNIDINQEEQLMMQEIEKNKDDMLLQMLTAQMMGNAYNQAQQN